MVPSARHRRRVAALIVTPFQSVLFDRISEAAGIDPDDVVVIYSPVTVNAKVLHYRERIAARYPVVIWRPQALKALGDLRSVVSLARQVRRLCGGHPDAFYTGAALKMFARLLAALLRPVEFHSFDDGYSTMGAMAQVMVRSRSRADRLLGLVAPHLTARAILENVPHHTIFQGESAFRNTRPASLLSRRPRGCGETGRESRVLLLPSNAERGLIEPAKEDELVRRIVDRFGITHAIRHPRSGDDKFAWLGEIVVDDLRIAEEVVLDLLDGGLVHLIGPMSTVFLSLADVPGLRFTCIEVGPAWSDKLDSSHISSQKDAIGALLTDDRFEIVRM